MQNITFPYEVLDDFCIKAFSRIGFDAEESRIITDVLLTSDLYGIESHGMQRIVRYHKGIEKGLIDIKAKPSILIDTPVSAVIDAHNSMGQLVGHSAMKKAIEKAKTSGIGIVSVRESNHYGIAGYYAKMACNEGLIGISGTNSEAIMVPTFGRLAMIGSNPIALCMPADPYPFFFDCSTTVVTRGKLELYNKMKKPLPDGWALDRDGRPSDNAAEVLSNIVSKSGGGIMPLGGASEVSGSHKGYGYGMVCEIFSSILSLGTTSNLCMKGKSGICHFFAAIDPKIFGDPAEIRAHLSEYLEEIRRSPKAEGAERIYTHGEKEVEATAYRLKNGIPLNVNTVREMADFARFVGLDPKKYFGDFDDSEDKAVFSENY